MKRESHPTLLHLRVKKKSTTITPEVGVFSGLLSMLSISSVPTSQRTPKAIGNVSISLPQSTTPLMLENSPSEDVFTSSVIDKSANLSELETMDTGMLTKPVFSTEKRLKTTPKSVKHSGKKSRNPRAIKTTEKHSKQSNIFTLPISPTTNVNLSEQSKTVKIKTTVYSTNKVSGNVLQSVSYSEKRSQAPTTYKTAKSDQSQTAEPPIHTLGFSSNLIDISSKSKYTVSSVSSHKEVIVQSEKTISMSGITTGLFQSNTSKPTISRLLSTEQPSSELSSSTETTDVPLCLCTCVIDPDEDICSCVCTITKPADITTTARKHISWDGPSTKPSTTTIGLLPAPQKNKTEPLTKKEIKSTKLVFTKPSTTKNALLHSNSDRSKRLTQPKSKIDNHLNLTTSGLIRTKSSQPVDVAVLDDFEKRLNKLKNKYSIGKNSSTNNAEFVENIKKLNLTSNMTVEQSSNIKAKLYSNFTYFDKTRIELESLMLFKLNKVWKNMNESNASPACVEYYKGMAKDLISGLAKSNAEKWNIIKKNHLTCHVSQNISIHEPSFQATDETTDQEMETQTEKLEGLALHYCNKDIYDLIVGKNSSLNLSYLIPFSSGDPCTIILKNLLQIHQHNKTNHSPEYEEIISKINVAIIQNRGSDKKALLLREYLEYEKLRKYLDHILGGKIDESDMRLAVVKSRKCWNYYTKLKKMFLKAMQSSNARKEHLIGNISMVCSEHGV
ncbi:uncharacterized protein LOC119557859 isoform X3 [Drosophila subpulchrella]|uniref:uncharacterized protein LOC119557859 isoform X3 n=1 Tax=Drosophila subpulchrella TaxID=1486046 RepID=UPI0018A13960|nr:uncharacterized protein LOC119557859 isoform X3 [Drosophila subpulchrella]